MIMPKQWLMEYGSKQITKMIELMKEELKVEPMNRDVASILRLEDAINFYDSALCLFAIVTDDFDVHLKALNQDLKQFVEDMKKEEKKGEGGKDDGEELHKDDSAGDIELPPQSANGGGE